MTVHRDQASYCYWAGPSTTSVPSILTVTGLVGSMLGGTRIVLVSATRSAAQASEWLRLSIAVVTMTWLAPRAFTEVGSFGQPLLPQAMMYISCDPFHAASAGGRPGDVHGANVWPGGAPSEYVTNALGALPASLADEEQLAAARMTAQGRQAAAAKADRSLVTTA